MKKTQRQRERIAITAKLCELVELLEDHANSFDLDESAEEAAELWLTVDSAVRRLETAREKSVTPKLSEYVREHGAIPLGLDNLCLAHETTSEEVALEGAEEAITYLVLDEAAKQAAAVIAKMLRNRKEGAYLPTQVGEVLNSRDVFYERVEKTKFKAKNATRNLMVLDRNFVPKRKAKREEGAA